MIACPASRQKEKGVFGARNPRVSTRNPFTPYYIALPLFGVYLLGVRAVKR